MLQRGHPYSTAGPEPALTSEGGEEAGEAPIYGAALGPGCWLRRDCEGPETRDRDGTSPARAKRLPDPKARPRPPPVSAENASRGSDFREPASRVPVDQVGTEQDPPSARPQTSGRKAQGPSAPQPSRGHHLEVEGDLGQQELGVNIDQLSVPIVQMALRKEGLDQRPLPRTVPESPIGPGTPRGRPGPEVGHHQVTAKCHSFTHQSLIHSTNIR